MADKIAIAGRSVPVVSSCVIDLTCSLSRSVENINELMDVIQNSDTLKTLELVHLRSQPDWILSQWCLDVPKPKKENMPEIKEAVDPNVIAQSNINQVNEKKNCPKIQRDVQSNEESMPKVLNKEASDLAKKYVHFWQVNEDLCVGKDFLSSNCMITLDVHSCVKLSGGSLVKLIAWLVPLPNVHIST